MRELQLARRPSAPEGALASDVARRLDGAPERHHLSACEHRSVSKDGRIICQKIVEGDPEVSPNLCRDCPFKAIDCAHLRFSLRLRSPSPLIVRFNGRTEVWDDGPPQLALARAACTERVMPVQGPGTCANCSLRRSLCEPAAEPRAPRPAAIPGKVVPFPQMRELAAAAG